MADLSKLKVFKLKTPKGFIRDIESLKEIGVSHARIAGEGILEFKELELKGKRIADEDIEKLAGKADIGVSSVKAIGRILFLLGGKLVTNNCTIDEIRHDFEHLQVSSELADCVIKLVSERTELFEESILSDSKGVMMQGLDDFDYQVQLNLQSSIKPPRLDPCVLIRLELTKEIVRFEARMSDLNFLIYALNRAKTDLEKLCRNLDDDYWKKLLE